MAFLKRQPPAVPTPVEEIKAEVEKEAEEISSQVWTLKQVPTEMGTVIYNTKTKENIDLLTAMVKILNMLEEFKEAE